MNPIASCELQVHLCKTIVSHEVNENIAKRQQVVIVIDSIIRPVYCFVVTRLITKPRDRIAVSVVIIYITQ